jgi:hypothetical protein
VKRDVSRETFLSEVCMRMKSGFAIMATVLLVGCSDPKSTEIPSVGWEQFSNKKFSKAMNKLETEDRELVNNYLYCVRTFNDTIPKGFTIGNAIDYMIQFKSSYFYSRGQNGN